MENREPFIGAQVFYFEHDGATPLAAIITNVQPDGVVSLAVFNRNGLAGNAETISFSAVHGRARRWGWPDAAPKPVSADVRQPR